MLPCSPRKDNADLEKYKLVVILIVFLQLAKLTCLLALPQKMIYAELGTMTVMSMILNSHTTTHFVTSHAIMTVTTTSLSINRRGKYPRGVVRVHIGNPILSQSKFVKTCARTEWMRSLSKTNPVLLRIIRSSGESLFFEPFRPYWCYVLKCKTCRSSQALPRPVSSFSFDPRRNELTPR